MTTKSYQQETPTWLWQLWTTGPGATASKYSNRITILLALDVLVHDDTVTPTQEERLEQVLDHAPEDALFEELVHDA